MDISIVQSVADLPNFENSRNLYVDFETTSGDEKKSSVNPWKDCKICGICITADEFSGAFYVPVGHRITGTFSNLPRDPVVHWLNRQISTAEQWINHNLKYDVHAGTNDFGIDPLKTNTKLLCTLTQAKLVNSDRLNYGLKLLNRDWLHDDSDYEKALEPYTKRNGRWTNKDYGNIPIDVLGIYGCYDVITNRRLHKYCNDLLPEQVQPVWETEQKITEILVEIERNGLHVDTEELKQKSIECRGMMLAIMQTLQDISGFAPFDPNSAKDCYEALIAGLEWDVVELTETGEASFNKEALEKYKHDPKADSRIVRLMQGYRKWSMLYGLYVVPYQELQVDGLLHPFYNQCVRTGRMSCRMPNAQQLSTDAKKLVHPPPGKVFISCDFSQIEFRLIAHYLQNKAILNEYLNNPNADFHQLVADMCGIVRKPAKNINFEIAFGGGKARTLAMLAVEPSLADGFDDTLGMTYQQFCRQRANDVFEQYHNMLPELKPTSYRASLVCKQRAYANGKTNQGYVFNGYGRRRHLPVRFAYRAFNTIIQSFAADLMKERMVALHSILPEEIDMVGAVHDDIIMTAPEEVARDPEVIQLICETMNNPNVELRVPIRTSYGIGKENWGEIEELSV